MIRIDHINIKGKRVLIRVDFNVPIHEGKIKSHFRINKTLDTINYCIKNNAKIILMSHLGRPKGITKSLSLISPHSISFLPTGSLVSSFIS